MSIKVILELQSKSESIDELKSTLKNILPDTRDYDGCAGVQLVENQDDSLNLIIYEAWESRQHYDTYLAWRDETGALEKLGEMLSKPPSIRYFDILDVL